MLRAFLVAASLGFARAAAAASLLYVPGVSNNIGPSPGTFLSLGGGGGGGGGFLTQSTGQFYIGNYLSSSNDFVPADGYWSAAGVGSSNPVVTTVSDTLPNNTTGNVSQAAFPAISAGNSAESILYYHEPAFPSYYPSVFGLWAKVVSGSGTLFTSISPTNVATYGHAAIPADGAWHLVQANWVGQSQQGAGSLATLEIGIQQADPGQQASVGATTIELTGAYFGDAFIGGVINYADVKVGGPIAAAGTNPIGGTISSPMPAGIALRDFSKWTAYGSNPIMYGNPNEVWASGGRGNPYIQSQFQSGGYYWAFNGECYSSPPVQNLQYIGQCLFKSTDGLNWTEDTLNAPYLFLTGSSMVYPIINSGGSGFTANASGTATWTGGGGCAVQPVIAVTTNTSGVITGATPSPNNGLGTGTCPFNALPTGTSWSYSGVGSGSGASFTWKQTEGTQAPPGPARWELHPTFLPYGCSDGTNPHNFCVIYSAEDSGTAGHLYMAWSDTVDGVYTPLGCTSGSCGTVVPATLANYPTFNYGNVGAPVVINVGGATGTNFIYVYQGSGADAGIGYEILTTPANKNNLTSGNTLTFLRDAGFTIQTGVDWYAPISGTKLLDLGIYLDHCGIYEMYFVVENASSPSPPWPGSSPAYLQIMGEAVSNSIAGPWYQYQGTTNPQNTGDPAAIELGGNFIITSTYNAPTSPFSGAGYALLGPEGTCPSPALVGPTNTSPPTITGTTQVGLTLTAQIGSWNPPNPPIDVYTYQWLDNGSPISGAVNATYIPVTGDAGNMISVAVTANNSIGNATTTSASVGPVAAAFCSQANTYLARTVGGNEGGNSANIANLICGLVTDGVITGNLSTTGCGTTLDALYIFAQQNSGDAALNLCGTNYTAAAAGTPTFTAYLGYNGFGVVSPPHITTNFNPATATSPNFVQNSASFGFWSVAVVTEGLGQMGNSSNAATGESNIFNAFTGNLFYVRVNNGTTGSVPNPGTKGLYVAERTSSTNVVPYWDGVAQAAQTTTSAAPESLPFLIGINSPAQALGTAQTIAEAHIGAALGATLNLAIYNRERTYMTAVGVP